MILFTRFFLLPLPVVIYILKVMSYEAHVKLFYVCNNFLEKNIRSDQIDYVFKFIIEKKFLIDINGERLFSYVPNKSIFGIECSIVDVWNFFEIDIQFHKSWRMAFSRYFFGYKSMLEQLGISYTHLDSENLDPILKEYFLDDRHLYRLFQLSSSSWSYLKILFKYKSNNPKTDNLTTREMIADIHDYMERKKKLESRIKKCNLKCEYLNKRRINLENTKNQKEIVDIKLADENLSVGERKNLLISKAKFTPDKEGPYERALGKMLGIKYNKTKSVIHSENIARLTSKFNKEFYKLSKLNNEYLSLVSSWDYFYEEQKRHWIKSNRLEYKFLVFFNLSTVDKVTKFLQLITNIFQKNLLYLKETNLLTVTDTGGITLKQFFPINTKVNNLDLHRIHNKRVHDFHVIDTNKTKTEKENIYFVELDKVDRAFKRVKYFK